MWSKVLVSPTRDPSNVNNIPKDPYNIHCTATIWEIISQGSHCT